MFGPDAIVVSFFAGMLVLSGLQRDGHERAYRLAVAAAFLIGPSVAGQLPALRAGAVPLSMVLAAAALYYLAMSRDEVSADDALDQDDDEVFAPRDPTEDVVVLDSTDSPGVDPSLTPDPRATRGVV